MLLKESPHTGFPAAVTDPPETLHRSLSLWNSLTIGFATVSPGHQVIVWGTSFHGGSHCGVLRDVPTVHCVRCGELSVYAEVVATQCTEDLFFVSGGIGGADVHSPKRESQSVETYQLPQPFKPPSLLHKNRLLMDPMRKETNYFSCASENLLSYGVKPEDVTKTERNLI